jgi:hypothetical protein
MNLELGFGAHGGHVVGGKAQEVLKEVPLEAVLPPTLPPALLQVEPAEVAREVEGGLMAP